MKKLVAGAGMVIIYKQQMTRESVEFMKTLKKAALSIVLAALISTTSSISVPIYSNTVYVEAATVKLNSTDTTLYVGNTYQLAVSGTKSTVTWSIDNEEVAKISKNGLVTGMKKGTATVTAKVGKKVLTGEVEVQNKELTATQIYEEVSKATVEITSYFDNGEMALGSGFFIDKGVIVTNYHVVGGANKIVVQASNGNKYVVNEILGYDKDIDIAVIKIDAEENEVLTINDEGVTVGEKIYILGSPLGLTGTFADGIVSSASRVDNEVDYIQVTAPMSPGNSGGPLINRFGEVMGINTWQYTDGQNLNFSININELKNIDLNNAISITDFYHQTVDNSSNSGLAKGLNDFISNTAANQNLYGKYSIIDYYLSPEGYYVAVIKIPKESN